MRRMMLLPRMAFTNIRNNGSTYFPYMGASIFAIFTYFVFDLILQNDIITTLPRAMYAMMLVQIGFWLLGIIMVPFLYYTNSFLIKRRKKELGLYSILGLEKKHIGMMMFFESIMLYVVVVVAAIGMGLLFSKLIFLLLINLAKLPVNASFGVSLKAVWDTLLFYAFVTGLNLLVNLFQVGKANPVELMSGTKKGEKEPKHIWLWSIVGALFMGGGYYMAVTAQLDSMIFVAFFVAVLFVVVGTYYLFTSGSIALLRAIKNRKKAYYRADNFITVSGMLYRMKKNAASLSNICIFATMVIVTVVCTLALYLGMDSVTGFVYPKDFELQFLGENVVDRENIQAVVQEMAEKEQVELSGYLDYQSCTIDVTRKENAFVLRQTEGNYADDYDVMLISLDEYNRMEGKQESLKQGEVLLYSTGEDFGYDTVRIKDREYRVKEELSACRIGEKEENNIYNAYYVVVLSDMEQMKAVAADFGINATNLLLHQFEFSLIGPEENITAFYGKLDKFATGQPGFAAFSDYRDDKADIESMYGGLLFIGIFYGLIFLVCLLIIMYYKQITEGFEDRKNFEIMQKVGMSDGEIRRTIKRQILLVFALPLFGALLHTAVAMHMVIMLLATIYMFRTGLVIACAVVVCLLFAAFYGFCYKKTAGTYYRIVKQM